ncbi:hypothetical protein [Halomicrococcus gelatinilyticus]|uniref:hypothetical protein n=1 Tax=Halomicrococcus gelatinilyticus TaxID=1702103 RepID=UPI002E13DF7A
MVVLKRDVPIVVMVVGMVASTAGADLVSSQELALGLAVGGSIVTWGTLFAAGVFLDDRIWGRLLSDERMNRITHRSGAAAWLLMLGVSSSLMVSLPRYGGTVSAKDALMAVQTVGIVAFVGAMAYNSRTI